MNPQGVENSKTGGNAKFLLTTSAKNIIYAYVRHPNIWRRYDETLRRSDRGKNGG